MTDESYLPPPDIAADMDTWVAHATTLLRYPYGQVRIILSAQTLLKNMIDRLESETETRSTDIAGATLRAENAAMASAVETLAHIGAEEQESSLVVDISNKADVEQFHTNLFEMLWAPYDRPALEEGMSRLENRLLANGLDKAFFAGKKCIDLGCASGRFSFVMSRLGAASVLGVDLGTSRNAGAEWSAKLGLDNVTFEEGDCYAIDRPDGSFDFIGSSGVAHHHTDFERGLAEMHRLLTPGGAVWMYLTGPVDDIWTWISVRVKAIMRMIPMELSKSVLKLCQLSHGAYCHVMDSFYAIYYYRSFEDVRQTLLETGFSKIKRLASVPGTDSIPDSDDPHRFGSGEVRLLATK
jgi:ubiquinone/menaquinone biosynthesis C-methylase UbiE